jgi:hypothetical protein
VPDIGRELDGVGAGRLKDRQCAGRLVIQQRPQRVAGRAQFDPRQILQQDFLSIRAGLDDDVAKLLFVEQAALGIDLEFEVDRLADGDWPTAPAATWMFCSRMALTTSLAVSPRAAAWSGLIQTRIA